MLSICLIAPLLFGGCALAGRGGPYSPVYRADAPAVIDGRLDEPFWQRAVRVEIDYRYAGQGGNRAETSPGYVKLAWDEHYLYFGYEVHDTDIRAEASGDAGGKDRSRLAPRISKHWDVVELFVSLNRDGEHFWEFHHNALNHFSDIYVMVPADPDSPLARSLTAGIRFVVKDDVDAGRGEEDAEFPLAFAVQLKPAADPGTATGGLSTVNDPSDTDTGWVGEIRLPWSGIGADRGLRDDKKAWRMEGQILKVLNVIQNGGLSADYAQTLFHTSPTKPQGWFHKGYEHWPAFRLQAQPAWDGPRREETEPHAGQMSQTGGKR